MQIFARITGESSIIAFFYITVNTKATSKLSSLINKFFKPNLPTAQSKRAPRSEKRERVVSAITGLIMNANISLEDLASNNDKTKTIKTSSLEQNARRMLDDLGISQADYATTIVEDIFKLDKLELAIDRTNWERGDTDINYFVVSVLWNNIAIPLYWELLNNNGGASNSADRIRVIQWIVDLFSADRISWIYADREFPSEEFINYLLLDSRSCNTVETLVFPEEFYQRMNRLDLAEGLSTCVSVPTDALAPLRLEQPLTIINTGTELFLIEHLQTGTSIIYPMIFPNQYKKLKLELNTKKLNILALASVFKGVALRNPINFVARIKSSTMVSHGSKSISIGELQKDLARTKSKIDVAQDIKRAFGNRLFISARINIKDDPIFLVSNVKLDNPFTIYRRRWLIETMFGKFKTLGFNLESTNLTKHQRLLSLFMIISIAYSCCCKIGFIVHTHIKPISRKLLRDNHYEQKEHRMQYSIFRFGFNLLKNFIMKRLFSGAVASNLLHKIIDSDAANISISKRSRIIKLLERA